MNELWDFLTPIGSIASVLGVLYIAVISTMRALRRRAESRRTEAARLEEAFARMRDAGKTAGGRTDLGFLVMLDLASLRDVVRRRESITDTAVIISFVGFWQAQEIGGWPGRVLWFGLLASMVYWIRQSKAADKAVDDYEDRVREVWAGAIRKRIPDPE